MGTDWIELVQLAHYLNKQFSIMDRAMKKLFITCLTALGLASGCTPFNPTGEVSDIRGKVNSVHFDSPLANATVAIPSLSMSVKTDENGYFRMGGLPTNPLEAVVSYGDHVSITRLVTPQAFGSKYVEFWMDTQPAKKASITFERDFDIWTSDLYGQKQTNITGHLPRSLHRTYPSWSGDKKQIAFVAYDPTSRLASHDGIWIMNSDGSFVHKLSSSPSPGMGRMYHLNWGNHGPQFLFLLNMKAYIYDRTISDTTAVSGAFSAADSAPAWTPDGKRIVFSAYNVALSNVSPSGRGLRNTRQVFIMDSNGSHRKRLTADNDNFSPSVSPDGKHVAFISARTGRQELWVMDIDGNNPRQLTYLKARRVNKPTWTSDGQFILFNTDYKQQYPSLKPKELWMVDRDGIKVRMMSNDAQNPDA